MRLTLMTTDKQLRNMIFDMIAMLTDVLVSPVMPVVTGAALWSSE